MNTEKISAPVGIVGKLLAVLCVATFWLIPFSPLVSIAAVKATRQSPGWPQRLAKTGAILSTICTLMLAALFLWILILRMVNGTWAF